MAFSNVRNYLKERLTRQRKEQQLYQIADADPNEALLLNQKSDVLRLYHGIRNVKQEANLRNILQSEFDSLRIDMEATNLQKREPFQFYTQREAKNIPSDRISKFGIVTLPLMYHKGQTVTATESVPETGFKLHPKLQRLLETKYPQYLPDVSKYCRPLGTTDATFSDFNKEQVDSQPIPEYRKERILSLIMYFLDVKPYLPLHFVDTQYAKLPLSTGTGYHNRHSYKINAHAKYSSPDEYKDKHTSKGFYLNAFLESARTIIHNIKAHGLPFKPDFPQEGHDDQPEIDFFESNMRRLNNFFNEYPTMMFTRNHISERDGNLKQRPVYAVDELFLTIETMLTFPLLVQARKMSCCIMYGLETIRGSNQFLDKVAQDFRSYFTIDWSQFDQRLPRRITDCYYHDFLPRLIIVDQGYQPTYEYPTYPDLTEAELYNRMHNLLTFLHLWYNNMTFLSQDGFAYRRTYAGVPSGMLNTQYLDSFGNLFLILDGFIEYGLSDDEIKSFILFIMGDDNSGFMKWPINKLDNFMTWFENYAKERWNMILSKTKSVVTNNRLNIETLGYRCNGGKPRRSISKLVAQLCYPEHGPIPKYMSARAIGIAVASCAQDHTFYLLCKDVYETFKDQAVEVTPETIEQIVRFLPGHFRLLDSYSEVLNLETFPTFFEIEEMISRWRGPLTFSPKWNYFHFMKDPDFGPLGSVTMYEYERREGYTRPPAPTFMHG